MRRIKNRIADHFVGHDVVRPRDRQIAGARFAAQAAAVCHEIEALCLVINFLCDSLRG